MIILFVGLECYNCNSEDDSTCLTNPSDKHNCGDFIMDLSSTRFRCMTVKAKQGDKSYVLRRCTTSNDCKYQVKEGKLAWREDYNDATCEECQNDLCNKD